MTPPRAAPADLPNIPVYRPDLSGNERRYVLDCLDTTWISSLGGFIERFEGAVAEYVARWTPLAERLGA